MAKFTWRELNQTLGTKTEAEVLAMLNEERSGRNRKVVLERLHQRYSILRVSRERLEIMPNEKGENWIAKGVPLESDVQNDAIGTVGFIPSEVSGIADEMRRTLVDIGEKLIASIDEQQATIETLKAINQDLKSTNEELRSAKSELQLPVEETVTVNSDLIPTDGAPSFPSGTALIVGISDLDKRIEEAIFDALNEFDKKCPYCSKNLYEGGIRDKIEIDHFIPVSKGGQHFPWNLMPICKDCNRKKRAKLPIDFLSPEVFDRVNTYLLQVRQKFLDEGIVAHSSINSLRELLIKNEDVIRQLNSHEFIKSLVHLVMPDRASLLERPTALAVGVDAPPYSGRKFPEFWQAYPAKPAARTGPVEDQIEVLLANGIQLDDILVGARAYAAFISVKPSYDSKYTREPKKWLTESGWLDDYTIQENKLQNMIRNRVGPFEQSVIGSPFHEICDRLTGSAPGGVKLPQQALLHALKEAGWQDMGRLGSADYPNKKHIFCAPELKHYRKSDLRRMVEVANNSNSATDQNK